MTPRALAFKALMILLLAAAISGAIWVSEIDHQVEQASLEQCCQDAAIWAAEESRGVPLNERVGQPDHKEIAAEQCPGMRPAGPALPTTTSKRQLARY